MIMMALITKENNPKVKIVIGKEIILRIGLTKILSIARTITTIIDDPNPSTLTPGKKLAKT